MPDYDSFPRGVPDRDDRNAPLATAKWSFDAPEWTLGHFWLGHTFDGREAGYRDDRHIVTVAGSRAGKGRTCIVPNLKRWPGSCAVTDPKGENATLTAVSRAAMSGHMVAVVDPLRTADVPDALRAGFNPLDLMILDEAAALGKIESVEKAAGLMAGFGLKLWTVWQDLGQIKRLYRESWETFLGNAGVLQFFANADMTTLEWLSKRLGQTEVIRETKGRSETATTGLSKSQGRTEQAGWSRQSGSTEGSQSMADLSQIAAREGGSGLIPFLSRARADSVASSEGRTYQQGESGGETIQTGDSASSGSSETDTQNEAIHLAALMTPDEIAWAFVREAERQIVLIDGVSIHLVRTAYDDATFERLCPS